MARGKNGAQASARRSQSEYETTIARLEREVKQYASELSECMQKLAAAKASHRADVLRMQEQIDEGASEALNSARGINAQLLFELGVFRNQREADNKAWKTWQTNAHRYAIENLGMSVAGAVEWVHELGEQPFVADIASIAEYGSKADVTKAILARSGAK